MRGFNNYNDIPEFSEISKLPAGAYEVKLIRAEERKFRNGEACCLLFDISEGEYKGYYRQKFEADKKSHENNPDKFQEAKYKGVYMLFYPNGGQYDETAEKRYKTAFETIKSSNPKLKVDFSKEWDGKVLKDCKVGMIFQDKEWEINGNTGFTAQPYGLITLEKLENGDFKLPDPKYLNGSAPAQQVQSSNDFTEFDSDDDDLPF